MFSTVDKHSGVPAYIQIINILKREILLGRLGEEDQLPPVRELERIFGVNVNTVMRALEHLQFEGILEARHGVGYFITSATRASSEIVDIMRNAVKKLRSQNVDLQMATLLMEEVWKE